MGDVPAGQIGGRRIGDLYAPEADLIEIFGLFDGKILSAEATLRKDESGA